MRYIREYNDWGYQVCSSFNVENIINLGNRLSRREWSYLLDRYEGNISFYSRSVSGSYSNFVRSYNDDIARIIIHGGRNYKNYVDVYKGEDDWFWVRVFIYGGLYYDETFYKCDEAEGLVKLISDKL